MLARLTGRLLPLMMIMAVSLAGFTVRAEADYGTLTGTVTDSATGDPISGASVVLVGTSLGGKTSVDGKYLIAKIPPGGYTAKVTYLGYTVLEEQVTIESGRTSRIHFYAVKAATDIGTITVKDGRDIIDKFVTGNEAKTHEEVISKAPMTSVDFLKDQLSPQVADASRSNIAKQKHEPEARQYDNPGQSYQFQTPLQLTSPPYYPAPSTESRFDDMYFRHYGVNPFIETDVDHLSTFAMDVDDASYSIAKSYIERGELPPEEAVRVEEFINHFDYQYRKNNSETFGINIDAAPSRFGGPNTYLLRIGIAAQEIRERQRKPANLVFVIDVSGSMAQGRRLEIVKDALTSLVDELRPDDRVGIVAYNQTSFVILEPTSIRYHREIEKGINRLKPGGSTNAEAGLLLGYQMASAQFQKGYTNRVILCSDGVANVGTTGADGILARLRPEIDRGITLTTVGVGMGNYNDVLLEQLGDKGNGHYAYINSFDDARRIFSDNLTGTLQVVARDAKIQVDFDPEVVRSYRLLGHENRDVADRDFRNDRIDGGEVGSRQAVTALYEVRFYRRYAGEEIGTVSIRYQHPDRKQAREVSEPIERRAFSRSFNASSNEFMLAAYAAEFAEIMRGSYWAKESSLPELYDDIRALAARTEDEQIEELASLIERAASIDSPYAER